MERPPSQTPEEEAKVLSRRAFLGAGVAAIGGAIAIEYFFDKKDKEDSKDKKDAGIEEVDELTLAKAKVGACVDKIRKHPFMEKPLLAKKQVGHADVRPAFTSLVIGVEELGVMKTLHIPDVGELSERVRDARGKGVYVHREKEDRYHITLEDTVVDIGVSNRFSVRKYTSKSSFSGPLPVHAVKRSRYEKRRVKKEIIDKNGRKKKIKDFEGDYVEYVTYTPPASHLMKAEVIGSGKEYIGVVLDAAHSLLAKRITSPDKKILTLCHAICKRVAIIEHIDPGALALAEKKEGSETEGHIEIKRKSLFQKMYAEYGLNQDNAFNHLINSLGAGGMMQIMKDTYRDVRARLIERKIFLPNEIPEDANVGRRDPLFSAIIAIYLCYDTFLIRSKFFSSKSADEIELSLVSMYNGSPNLFEKILKGEDEKSTKSRKSRKSKTPTPKEIPLSLRDKILTHNQGRKLPGSGEPENRNYLRKYLLLKSIEKSL